MSSGPGGPAVYSIPAVEFSNNGGGNQPQLIATPQSGFMPTQGMSGQQIIIVHGPNGSYQHVSRFCFVFQKSYILRKIEP